MNNHENCINKEKIIRIMEDRIIWLKNEITNVKSFKQIAFYIWEEIHLKDILIKIQNKNIEIGDFDNDY